MPTYSATIQLSNGTLSVTRPHPSDEAADDLIDSAIYAVRDGDNPVTSIGITIVTEGSAPAALPPLAEPLPPSDPDGEDTTSPASSSSTGSVSGPLR
jgi:hypothetical protein